MSLHLPKPSSIVRPQNEDVQMSSAPNETTHSIPQPRLSTSPSTSASSSHWFSKLPSLQQQQHQLQQRSETGPSSASLTSQLARQAARELRQERANAAGRSPFVPKKVQQGHGHGHAHAHGHLTSSGKGKGRALDHEEEDHLARTALSQMSLEELEQRLERSSDLLNSPATLSRLPGGDSKIRQQQTRLLARIQELRDVGGLGEGLSKTTIASEDGKTVVDDVMEFQAKGMDNEAFEDVKPAIVHGEMERVPEDDPSTSPLVKRRLAARQSASTTSPSIPGALSLAESMELQRAHVARERAQADLRAKKEAALARMAASRQQARGGVVTRGSKGIDTKANIFDEFMSHAESDSDGGLHLEEDDDDSDGEILDVDAVLHAASAGAAQSVLGAATRAGTVGFDGRSVRRPSHPLNGDEVTGDHHVEHEQEHDEDEAQLNPFRTAYESGWRRAEMEEQVLASAMKKTGTATRR